MTTTQWPALVTALVTAMRATSGYVAPTATGAGIRVYDGPEYALYTPAADSYLIVGWSGDPDAPEEPSTSGQAVAVMATTRRRDETGTVRCQAAAQNGGGDIAALRTAAFAIVAAVEAQALAIEALGVTGVWQGVVVNLVPEQRQTQQGGLCAVTFDVSYKARL